MLQLGLMAYPVLQAADILLYKCVGGLRSGLFEAYFALQNFTRTGWT